MKSIFNRLLASLVMCDNLYLFLTIVEIMRRELGDSMGPGAAYVREVAKKR